jgi:hypothetical protein
MFDATISTRIKPSVLGVGVTVLEKLFPVCTQLVPEINV